jgi:hypothetical protein
MNRWISALVLGIGWSSLSGTAIAQSNAPTARYGRGEDVDLGLNWDGDLLVRQIEPSGASALLVFTPGQTPAPDYAGCVELTAGEAPSLCP